MRIDQLFRTHGPFLRRRDLLALGLRDRDIRAALVVHAIFRVRQGWYALPSTPEDAVRAIRVGGRLTGVSALASYGFDVPRPRRTRLLVPRNACRLRRPDDRGERLRAEDDVDVRWSDSPRLRRAPESWRVTVPEALGDALAVERREIAIACVDAVRAKNGLSEAELAAVFARAPARTRGWRALSAPSASWGETVFRLRCGDAGIPFEPHPWVPGVGQLDGRIGAHTYVEIDGAQHDEEWDGESRSSFEDDHVRDLAMTSLGDHVLRVTYRQLFRAWPSCIAAMERAIADDELLSAARQRHPYAPRERRKRRRSRVTRRRSRSPNP